MRALALLALLALPSGAVAEEAARVSWDGCTSNVTETAFTGPGLYTMTASVAGSGRTIKGYELMIDVMDPLAQCLRGSFPPAWEFDAGGCNAGNWSVAYTNPSCATIPGITGTASLYEGGPYDASRRIRVEVLLGAPVTLEADKTYNLATITFDHSKTAAFASVDSCGGGAEPICLYLSAANSLDEQNQLVPWNGVMPGLMWNKSGWYCPFLCDAALPKTWGSLKASYR